MYGGDDVKLGALSFTKSVCDTNIDASWQLMVSFSSDISTAGSYTQVPRDTTIKAFSWASIDSAFLHIEGIRSDGKWGLERLSVPAGVTAATTQIYSYFAGAYRLENSDSPVIVYSDAYSARGSLLDTLGPVVMDAPIAQMFSGSQYEMIISEVTYTVPDSSYAADFELRCYPDDSDSRTDTTGYFSAARARVDGAITKAVTIPLHIRLPKSSYAAVWSKGETADQRGCATIIGRRWKK